MTLNSGEILSVVSYNCEEILGEQGRYRGLHGGKTSIPDQGLDLVCLLLDIVRVSNPKYFYLQHLYSTVLPNQCYQYS